MRIHNRPEYTLRIYRKKEVNTNPNQPPQSILRESDKLPENEVHNEPASTELLVFAFACPVVLILISWIVSPYIYAFLGFLENYGIAVPPNSASMTGEQLQAQYWPYTFISFLLTDLVMLFLFFLGYRMEVAEDLAAPTIREELGWKIKRQDIFFMGIFLLAHIIYQAIWFTLGNQWGAFWTGISEKFGGNSFFSSLGTFSLFSLLWMMIPVAVSEEILFRGFTQKILVNRLGKWAGLLITSILFGLVHFSNIILAIIYATLFGFFAGLIYEKTKRIWGPILFHWITNSAIIFIAFVLPTFPIY